jgi:hypothetical protein
VLFDFESGRLDAWRATGTAWGKHPASGAVGKQGAVGHYGGRYYVTSYHNSDDAVGTLSSPPFIIAGSQIVFRKSGGRNQRTLRIELWVNGKREKIETGNQSERMEEKTWNVASYSGQSGQIVLVDEETGPWGHLNVDEFWLLD